MAAPDRQTQASRSGFVPRSAIGALVWACAVIVACLNPMPEEFPSGQADVDTSGPGRGEGGGAGGPSVPGPVNDDDPDDLFENPDTGSGAGTGGASGTPAPPNEGAAEQPDAGADAGTLADDSNDSDATP